MEGETIMLYKEWIDFVVYPLDPNRVSSLEQRIDTSNAIRYKSEEYEKHSELVHQQGLVITKDQIIFGDDKFEAMAIGDSGNVFIWTEKRVWTLLRRFGDMEKLNYSPRHPELAGMV